jgi:peptide/nickel transport system substrate-binding protein
MPIVPEHIWKDVAEDEVKRYPNEPESEDVPVVGSGPFKLVEGEAGGSTYRFVRNDDYWDGVANVGEVVMQVYRSEDTLVQALKAGDIDFAEGVTALQIKALQGDPAITAQAGDSPGFDEIAFNTGSVNLKTGEPLGDPSPAVLDKDFRFALNFAIDRAQLAEKVYQGAAEPAGNIIPPAYSSFAWEGPPDAYAYDPDRTAQLLDDAGYTVGDDGWRTMPDGSPIGKLRLFARSDSETSQATMAFFKEWLADVKIDSTVSAMESSKLTNVILDGEFDAFEWGWYVEPDPDSILSYFTCDQRGGWSDSWYCDPDYDRLYEEQNRELDDARRAEIVKQMQEMLYEDAPYLNTAYNQIGEAYRSDRWEGFVPQPNPGGVLLFQYGHANYLNLAPAGTSSNDPDAADGGSGGGVDTGDALMYGGGALLVGGALVGGLLAYRRSHADQRE